LQKQAVSNLLSGESNWLYDKEDTHGLAYHPCHVT